MVNCRHAAISFFLLITFGLMFQGVSARRSKVNRRRDEADLPEIARSGWTVPLEGAETCNDTSYCTDRLSAPPSTSTLQYLAIGRGTITYTCAGQPDNQPPLYVAQNAFLYDAAPLVPKFSSEDQFHSYIPRFLQYDYTSLDNSSLTCIGNAQRVEGMTIFEIYNVDAYPVKIKDIVNSPNDAQFDLSWAHSQDDDNEWDIYRVETAGGEPPYNCGDQVISDEISAEYVAEYWFYRGDKSGREGQAVVRSKSSYVHG